MLKALTDFRNSKKCQFKQWQKKSEFQNRIMKKLNMETDSQVIILLLSFWEDFRMQILIKFFLAQNHTKCVKIKTFYYSQSWIGEVQTR